MRHQKGGVGYEVTKKVLSNYLWLRLLENHLQEERNQREFDENFLKKFQSIFIEDFDEFVDIEQGIFRASGAKYKDKAFFAKKGNFCLAGAVVELVERAYYTLQNCKLVNIKTQCDILNLLFFTERDYKVKDQEIYEALGLKRETYLNTKHNAISNMSRLMFPAWNAILDTDDEYTKENLKGIVKITEYNDEYERRITLERI